MTETVTNEEGGLAAVENRFWFTKGQFASLPALFREATADTPFEGSRLVFTGECQFSRDHRCLDNSRYEFELRVTTDSYRKIPGYDLAGFVKTKDGGEHYRVHTIGAGFEFTKEIVDGLDPLRCDVCGTRRFRTRQFILIEEETGKLVVVGGTCAKKFYDVNLESLIRKFFKEAARIFGEISDGLDSLARSASKFHEVCYEVAVAEEIIRKRGYVSKGEKEKAGERGLFIHSTADLVSTYFATETRYNKDEKAFVRELVVPNLEAVRARATEFEETEFKVFIDYFEAANEEKWSEFNNNCIAWLSDRDFGYGLSAFFGTVQARIDGEDVNRSKKRKAVKAFDGAPVNKMADFGKLLVVRTKWKQDFYGDYLCFTTISEDGGKLWFKVKDGSQAELAWNEAVGDRHIEEDDGVEVDVRGKVSCVKDDIAFAKNVKFKAVHVPK